MLTYKTYSLILMQVTILILPVGFDKVVKNVNPQGWAITLSDEISSHNLNKSISSSTQTSLTTLLGGSIIERFWYNFVTLDIHVMDRPIHVATPCCVNANRQLLAPETFQNNNLWFLSILLFLVYLNDVPILELGPPDSRQIT